ncbi:MAG: acyltransferase [Novosphingobium sp.]|uniref:acyltransferase family protein n=1 Tax=Novosphingobium sp. TaxID=1874826 RepID=UPI003C7DF417
MTAPGSETAHRFTALDSLRGIAAMGVAVHHIQATHGPASWALFVNGGQFVDFFFVLSGFVIAGVYGERLADGFSLLKYAVLRLGRVWPLHAFMVLLGLAVELLSLVIGQHGLSASPPFEGLHDPLHFVTALLLLDGWIPDWTNYYSRASWTISVEVVLYALAALALRYHRAGLSLFAVLALLALGAMLQGWQAPLATHAIQRGLTGFALGMACWYAHLRLCAARLPLPSILEGVSLGCLLVAIAYPPSYPTLAVIVPSGVVVLVFARQQGAISRVLCASPWAWLGQVSYALYMVHAMVKGRATDMLVLLSKYSGVPMADWSWEDMVPVKRIILAPLPSTLAQLSIVALMLLAANLAHRWIEEPARQWSRRLAARL